MRSVKTLILVVPLMSGLIFTQAAPAETWVDVTGKFRVEAKFLSASGGNVYLETEDGKRIAVPIERLSPESHAQAKRLYEAAVKAGASGDAAAPAIAMPASASAAGDSKLGDNPTAKETAEILTVAMTEFDVETIWDAFPAKHQKDVEEIVQLAANSIDEQTWTSVTSLLQKVSKLATDKKEFFLNNEMIGGMLPPGPETAEMWDAAAEMLNVYANSSLTDQSAMKSFTMDQFIANDVPKMRASVEKLKGLTENMQDTPFGQMSEIPTVEIVSETDSEAVVNITAGGQTNEQKFVKVDNRWVPSEMVDGWDEGLQEARDGLAQLATPEGQQGMAQMRMGLMMASAPLDQLLGASSQEQFDAVIQQFAGMAMGMMGGMGGPGGPGGPPPGFGGPPPGFGEGGPPPGFGEGDAPPPGFEDGF